MSFFDLRGMNSITRKRKEREQVYTVGQYVRKEGLCTELPAVAECAYAFGVVGGRWPPGPGPEPEPEPEPVA